MSSPLQSLKKNKVPLFPNHMAGQRPIPFRHPEYSEDESRLLEEITTSMVQSRRKRDPFVGLPQDFINGINPATGTRKSIAEKVDECANPPTDHDLMRMMMNKIAFLEQENKTQKEEIRVKDRRIKVLEDKLRIMEKSQGQGVGVKETAELEKHCLLLQQQVHEMETFLSEYGMVWVGEENNENSDVYLNAGVQANRDEEEEDDDDGHDNDEEEGNNKNNDKDINDVENNNIGNNRRHLNVNIPSSFVNNPLETWRLEASFMRDNETMPIINIDFDVLVENIGDLNVLAGEGVAQIKKTSDGARFEIPEPVQLTMYANGLLMFNGPFRPYTDPATRQCVQDLLDGYFPSELQQRYPDGVPFLLTDLRGVNYQTKSSPQVFTGEGQTLGGEKKPSRLISSKYQDPVKWSKDTDNNSLPTTSQFPGKTLTESQFMRKLPKSVVKDSKVIDIRNSISDLLKGTTGTTDNSNRGLLRPKSNITLIPTEVTKEMSDNLQQGTAGGDRPKSFTGHKDVTTLRVVSENGDQTFIVKMKFRETVGALRSYLDKQRRAKVPYDIVSTFPHKVHKNNTMTLEDSGLTPNAVLHLKPCL